MAADVFSLSSPFKQCVIICDIVIEGGQAIRGNNLISVLMYVYGINI